MASDNVLSVEGLTKSFGERTIFEGLQFGLSRGQKCALVAKNGTGKSTLMKILMGQESPDSGRVTFEGQLRVAHLDQDHGLDIERSIIDNLFIADNDAMRAIRRYEVAIENEDPVALQQASDAMDMADAWSYEAQAKEILGKLNLHDTQRVVGDMSGGERRRVALAKVLIQEADLLLLDEPTNHLDLGMIEWLEQHLSASKTTLLMITHDRFFLEIVCDEILELESGELHRYKGNWSYFLEKKAERNANEHAQRSRARSMMRRELEWVRATPQARTGKSKSRLDAFDDLKKRASVRLEDDELILGLDPHRLGGKIVEFHKVSKGFGDRTLMNQWTQHMKRNDRVGLVGPNGSGKSTLLGMMTGNLEPDAGKVVIGETVRFGHFTQEPTAFDPEMKVIEAVHEIAEYMPLKKGKKLSAAQLLERFLFPRSMHHQFIRKLSGGERKRLQMLRVLMANPNFLVLDEPTNDLDVFALGILEEFLLEFPGCLVVVSHDRYFMDKMVEHVWVLEEGGGMRDFPGNYTQYRTATDAAERQTSADKKQADRSAATTRPNTGPTAPPKGDYSNRLSFKEQYEYDHLEEDIEKLEQERSNLEAELAEKSAEHDEVLRISVDLGKVVDKIDKKTLRWIELSERA
jgi:ABC transport system ATP-binding/permease protein